MNVCSAFIVGAMMLLTVSDVIGRFIFDHPIIGTTEITEYMLLCIGFLGLAWGAVNQEHIKVDLIIAHLSTKARTIVTSITLILGIGIYSFIVWRSFIESIKVYKLGSNSSLLQIPDYPFYIILIIGCVVFCIAMITVLVQTVKAGVKR